jgi:hypothetical protein
MDFDHIKIPVAKQFALMSKHELYRVQVPAGLLFETYLKSFPEGTDTMYKTNTYHNCSCCRRFIRDVGPVVAIINDKIVSVWDIKSPDEAYQTVADALATMVREHPIKNLFRHRERQVGIDKENQNILGGESIPWTHFHVMLPTQFVMAGTDVGKLYSTTESQHGVMLRGLDTIGLDVIDTVLELIGQKSIYRGEQYQNAVEEFRKLQVQYTKVKTASLPERQVFVWSRLRTVPPNISCIRNTAIGVLLSDLAELDLNNAGESEIDGLVRKFNSSIMAPTTFQRPTSVVTASMINKAKEKLQELGLLSALSRRFAVETDLSINDMIFTSRSTRQKIVGTVFDELTTEANARPKTLKAVEEISIDDFLANVVKSASNIEVLFENRLSNNLVSLIAPKDPTANQLFKWDNPFSYSYVGELADSIKERVKAAGGRVEGDVLVRLAWFNYDDLDLHMLLPDGEEICFSRKRHYKTGGYLDVDMNVSKDRRDAVENIALPDRRKMIEGNYRVYVRNFRQREKRDVGFDVQFEALGTTHEYAYREEVRDQSDVDVVSFSYSHAKGIEIIKDLPSTIASKTLWGLKTQEFVRVSALMLSPNFWGKNAVDNKHYFFMLEGAQNDGKARGFYNEFLKPELREHRKVLEVVGSRTTVESVPDQLSGLGFSYSQRNKITVRVTGKTLRTMIVTF